MEWFRTDTGVTRHKDFVRLRGALKLSRVELAGFMLCLFEAVAESEEYGDLSDTPDDVIEEWVDWPKDRAGEFVSALRACNWLKPSGEFSGWHKRHEALLKARDAKRRARKSASSNAKRNGRRTADGQPTDSRRTADGQPPAAHRTVPYQTNQTRKDELICDATASPTKTPIPRKRGSHPVNRVIDAYHDAHIAATGAKPLVKGAQAGKLVKDALAVVPLEEMLALVPLYFEAAREPSLSGFLTTWMLEKLRAQYRARSGGAHEPERDGWLPEQRALCAAIKSYADGSLYARASWWPRAAKISVGDDGLWIMLDQRMIHDFAECWRAYDAAGRPEPLGWLKANVALMDKPTYEASVRTPAATGAA